MTAQEIERFRRIEALFDAALEYPPGQQRDAFLRREGATDGGLLDQVRQLLEDDARVTSSIPPPPETLPTFGVWQAIRLLGRGGMGVVYLAERADGAFRMRAAVKVVPLALASIDIEERFRRERQFLASLDHPKIARLIDGGLTSAGLPYLVMEYVDGLPIDRYCDARQLDKRARIALMRQVLEALIYVHGQQVIHRDLKSSNILADAAGNAKLLDFGTARLVDASGDNAITKSGVFAFTPECASPEQVRGKPATFASDTYSAGVLLYRLLTGRPPYQLLDDSSAVAETISHVQPEASGLDAPLDAILGKALRKDPLERYPSAAEMDADLARYLDGRPVQARPPRGSFRWIAIGIAAVALCAVGAWYAVHRNAAMNSASIAVLPFESSGPEGRYLADGVTDEITEMLSRRKTPRVIAPASAATFRRKTTDVRQARQLLNVTNVLTGSVEKTGESITVVASLSRTSDGVLLWTNTYHRQIADLPSIEGDLEVGIAASLGISKARNKKHVSGQQAHDYYLKGRFEENQATPAANAQAQQDYRRALQLDPDYAEAWWGLGAAIWNRNTVLRESAVPAEIKNAVQCSEKAIQLDPELSSAHAALGLDAMYGDWDWNRAEREFQAAIAAGQSAGAESGLALLYLITGRGRDADIHMRRARDLDPLSSAGTMNYALLLYGEGRFAESREEFKKGADQNPGAPGPQITVLTVDTRLGRTGEAIRKMRQMSQPQPFLNYSLAMAEALAGHRDEALRIVRAMEQSNADGHIPMNMFAGIYGNIGDVPNTAKYLERAMDLHELPAIYIHVAPNYSKMQNTPEFHRLKKRMNLDW